MRGGGGRNVVVKGQEAAVFLFVNHDRNIPAF